jgi:hypothetical protein
MYRVKQITCYLFLLFCLAPYTFAGELILNNGDRLEGELVGIEGDNLVWNSVSFGELQVATSRVDSVQTTLAFKLDGHEEPCYWLTVNEGIVQFECDNGEQGKVELMLLDTIVPHQEYVGGHYNYRGKLTVSGRQSSGNKEEEIWAVDSETLFRRGDYRHETQIEFDSISLNNQPSESRGETRYSLDWFFAERWFWYNNVQFGFDEPANIDESYIYGTGAGYQVWETATSALSVETGIDYVKEFFHAPSMPTLAFEDVNETAAWRWALDFRYLLPYNTAIFHRHQLIKSLEESEDWLLDFELGLSMPLMGQLYTEVKLDYDVDNLPVEGNRREDKQVTVGVGYSW